MPHIVIANLNEKTFEVQDTSLSLLAHFQHHRQDWMHACGGKGRCTTCKLVVLDGMHNLSARTPAEEKYILQGALKPHERLACQVKVRGNVRISVPEASKLPHLSYSF